MKRRTKKWLICLAVFLGIAGSVALVYLARPPLVIVEDEDFLLLYGAKRANMMRRMLSATLFRRVAFAVVARDADQDDAAFAVNAVSKSPYMALFPERYLGDADRYAMAIEAAGLSKKTRTLVINSGESEGVNIERAESIPIDRETDLYRAGMCAAILAKDGSIMVYYQGNLPSAHREAFIEGLTASGYKQTPFFFRNTESVPQTDIGCAVLLSAVNTNLLVPKQNVPIILFSWLEPEYTPNGVTIVFDDSLPAIASQVARGGKTPTASISILAKRLHTAADLVSLKAVVNAERK
jgi:hypothetical protein